MSHNTDAIVHELHVEFELMLSYVKDSQTATADQVERGLFRRLLSLGARLMLLFFALRMAAAPCGGISWLTARHYRTGPNIGGNTSRSSASWRFGGPTSIARAWAAAVPWIRNWLWVPIATPT